MNFWPTSFTRCRSAPSESGVAASTSSNTALRNLFFNFFSFLFGLDFGTSSENGLLVRQQRDQGARHQHNPADPHPHRQRIIESLNYGLLTVTCAALEHDMDVILGSGIDRNLGGRLLFLSCFVEPLFGIKVRDFFAVFEETDGRFVRGVVGSVLDSQFVDTQRVFAEG